MMGIFQTNTSFEMKSLRKFSQSIEKNGFLVDFWQYEKMAK